MVRLRACYFFNINQIVLWASVWRYLHFRKVIAPESVMSIRTIILLLLSIPTLIVFASIGIDAGPLGFVASAYGAATILVTNIVSILADKKANKAKESSVMPIALITLILATLATPASAFAQVIQESDMVSSTTTSIIANSFTALILCAFVAGAFTGIYTIIAKNRKTFQFGVTAVLSLLGAALFISLAGMLLPYTATGYVAQDMVAITMFSAIVLLTGMSAIVNKADNTLTAKEKAAILAEKARIAAAQAAHQAEIDSVNELARLVDTLRIMTEFTEGKYLSCVAAPTLSSKLDWKNGVNRARYMGQWPNEK
jgi:MFS family permease